MLEVERDAALRQETWLDRQRYRPQQWGTRQRWRVYQAGEGEAWFGFGRVRALDGLSDDIAMVPLIGHTLGHCGVAVRHGDRWLLQAGDAYFFHAEMDFEQPHCTPGLAFYQRMMDKDHASRVWNQQRLRELQHANAGDVAVFCAHDVVEFERITGRSIEVPAEHIVARADMSSVAEDRSRR
jgi:glyoxylase-like metal-dependent hydrolase (beta-lactamase superfamily II)